MVLQHIASIINSSSLRLQMLSRDVSMYLGISSPLMADEPMYQQRCLGAPYAIRLRPIITSTNRHFIYAYMYLIFANRTKNKYKISLCRNSLIMGPCQLWARAQSFAKFFNLCLGNNSTTCQCHTTATPTTCHHCHTTATPTTCHFTFTAVSGTSLCHPPVPLRLIPGPPPYILIPVFRF